MPKDLEEDDNAERRGDYRVLKMMLNEFEKRQALRDDIHQREVAGIRLELSQGFASIERRERKCSEDLWKEVNIAKAAVPAHVDAYHSAAKTIGFIRAIVGIVVGAIALLSFIKLFVLGG